MSHPTAVLSRPPRIFYGWVIVAACAFQTTFLATLVFSYGIFFSKITSAFGWSTATTSLAFSFQRVQGGFAQPLAGFLVQKLGPRTMVFIGMGLVGVGLILLSRVQELWHFYAAVLVTALGMSLGFGTVVNSTLVAWFRRNRSRALGLVYSGTPLAGFTVALLGFLVVHFGWRDAALMVGFTSWVVGVLVVLAIRPRPEPYGYRPDGDPPEAAGRTTAAVADASAGLTFKEAMRSRAFWVLAVGMGFEGMAMNSIIIHQVKHLDQAGLSTGEASWVVSASALAYFLGRLPFAIVGDRLEKRWLMAGLYLCAAGGILAYAFASHIWPIGIFVFLVGIAHGALVPMRPAAIADYVGTRSFASIAGFFELPSIAGGVAGPYLMGRIFDERGDYQIGFYAFAALLAIVAPLFLLLPRPRFGSAERA